MSAAEENIEVFECDECKNTVKADDEFCAVCGTLFEDNVFCSNHEIEPASGVCIICCEAFCSECGIFLYSHFLCNRHSGYEIYQGMARVFGDLDDTNVQYARSCLEQEGLHPLIFSRTQPKGGSRLVSTLYEANGDIYGHIVNEIKLMVPCQEVTQAEEILIKLEIIK